MATNVVSAVVPSVVPSRWRARYRLTPWWGRVIAVWALSRVVTTALVLTLASVQGPNAWTGASPSYVDFANIWDGRWYNIVAGWGYPSELPLDAAGNIAENALLSASAPRWCSTACSSG
jgi:hypothetical protein